MADLGTGSEIQISDLGGVWKRTLLIDAQGERDEASEVYWLQVGSVAGDIRASVLDEQAETAFVGWLSKHGSAFRWDPVTAHGSVTDGSPDEGYLAFEGRWLREDGVHTAYVEYWERDEFASKRDCAVEFRTTSGESGYLIEVGRYALCTISRPGELVFVLAEARGGRRFVRLCLGCDAKRGDTIAWPILKNDTVAFEDSCFGPRMVGAAHRLS